MANGVFSVDVTTQSYTAQAGYTAYLYWSETSTGINDSTPYSVVSLTFKMKRLYSWAAAYNTGSGLAYTFKIDGTTNETGNVTYNTQSWTVGTEYTLWSKSVTINHNSDGSKTAAFSFAVTDSVLSAFTLSGNAALTNIPMASTVALSASSVNLGTSNATITANITRYSTAYYHKLVWKIGSTTVETVQAGQVASSTYTLTPSAWLTKMTNSPSATCSVTLTTYSDSGYSTQLGGASTATFTLNCTANPTVGITAAPRGTAYNNGMTSYYYSGYSTALLTATNGAGVQGSTISKYEFYQGSSLIQSGTGTTKTTGTLSGTSAITFKVIVTDSRGRTGSASVNVTPIAYSAPSLTVNNCYRCVSSGTASVSGTYINVKATATANATGNSITSLKFSSTTSGGTAVQSNVALTSGTALTTGSGNYAVTTTYNVTFSATDKMGNTVTVTKQISATVTPVINVKDGGTGIAFGKYSESAGVVETPWHLRFSGNAKIQYQGTKNTYNMIDFIDNSSDEYGNGIVIGGGGQTIIGGGESAATLKAQAGTAGAEYMWVGNDGNIEFYPSQQNGYDASTQQQMSAGGFWVGVEGNTTRTNYLGSRSGAGMIYFYSDPSTTGNKGINAKSSGGSYTNIFWIDQTGNGTFGVANPKFTGNLRVADQAQYPTLHFQPSYYTGTSWLYPACIFVDFGGTSTISKSNWCFRSYIPNSTANTSTQSSYVQYQLPPVSSSDSAGAYYIVTTKTPAGSVKRPVYLASSGVTACNMGGSLFSGSFTSGSKILTNALYNYNYIVVYGTPNSGNPKASCFIRTDMLTASDQLFSLGNENAGISFKVKYSNNDIVITWNAGSGGLNAITDIYGGI